MPKSKQNTSNCFDLVAYAKQALENAQTLEAMIIAVQDVRVNMLEKQIEELKKSNARLSRVVEEGGKL